MLRGRVIGQYDERDVRRTRMHGAQYVDAGPIGELIVEQHEVGIRTTDAGDRVGGRSCLADDFNAIDAIDELAQPFAHRRNVVDDEDGGAV